MEKENMTERFNPSDYQAPCGVGAKEISSWQNITDGHYYGDKAIFFSTSHCAGCILRVYPDGITLIQYRLNGPVCGKEGWLKIKGEEVFHLDKTDTNK